jgi:hypothetical protein
MNFQAKIVWRGTVVSVQPRSRLLRSFDERSHSYLGYVVIMDGQVGEQRRPFSVALGTAVYAKHQIQAGDELAGEAMPVADRDTEVAAFYKASNLKVVARRERQAGASPPWTGVAPDLPTYRPTGNKAIAASTHEPTTRSARPAFGLSDADRDHRRQVEPEQEVLPQGDLLLRPALARSL